MPKPFLRVGYLSRPKALDSPLAGVENECWEGIPTRQFSLRGAPK